MTFGTTRTRAPRSWVPSPAMAVALLALALSVSGAAGAATRLILGRQLKPHTITARNLARAAVDSAALAPHSVTSSSLAHGAVTATSISPAALTRIFSAQELHSLLAIAPITAADIADDAVTTAKLADQAVTGTQLADGAVGTAQLGAGAVGTGNLADASVTSAKLAALEPIHFVGSPGQPAFIGPAHNFTQPTSSNYPHAGFYKDAYGVVHLIGLVSDATQGPPWIFQLPAGYQPGVELTFAASAISDPGRVDVTSTGLVLAYSNDGTSDGVSLDGITFRTDE